ncbi:MAG TPA: hypothetical protein VKN99_17190 [Polyangia bacterium]|nr:hypothetical protein [Polyangia bacterium]
MAAELPRFALCAGCGRPAQAQCAACHSLVCGACVMAQGCRLCVREHADAFRPARRAHPNGFAHGLLTILFAAATLSFTFGLEHDPAWAAYLLSLLCGTLVAALASARDVERHGDTFSFLICLTAGIQVMRATQRGSDGILLLAAFLPFALALQVAQRRHGWRRFVRYLALLVVPALASRMLLAGQAPLAAAWVAVAVALVV